MAVSCRNASEREGDRAFGRGPRRYQITGSMPDPPPAGQLDRRAADVDAGDEARGS